MVKQTHLVALTLALVWLCSGAIGIAVAQESAKSSDSKNKTYFLNSDCQNAQSSQEKPKVGRSGAAKAGFAMMLGPGVKLGPGFKPKAGVQVMDSSGNLIYPRQNTTISSERPSIKDSIEPKKAEPIELKNAASAAGQNPSVKTEMSSFESSPPARAPAALLHDHAGPFKVPAWIGEKGSNRSLIPGSYAPQPLKHSDK